MHYYYSLLLCGFLFLTLSDHFCHSQELTYQLSTVVGGEYIGDGGLAKDGFLRYPGDLAISSTAIGDGGIEIYVSDYYNKRIRLLSQGFVFTAAKLESNPKNVVMSPRGDLYFSGGSNVCKLLSNGSISIIGKGSFSDPYGLFIDSNDNIYVADNGLSKVFKIVDGVVSVIAGTNVASYGGDGQLATDATFKYPMGVALNSLGEVIITDYGSHTIRKILTNGTIITIAGNGIPGYNGDNILAVNAQIQSPYSLTIDSNDDIYFSSLVTGGRIRKISSTTGLISTLAGNTSKIENYIDGLPAMDSFLISPNGVNIAPNGDIYFVEIHSNRVRKVSATNSTVSTIIGNSIGDGEMGNKTYLFLTTGLAVHPNGDVYFSENQRIRKLNKSSGIVQTIAGKWIYPGYEGDGNLAINAEVFPYSITIHSSTGDLYFIDRYNSVVRRISISTGFISTVFGSGERKFAGDGGLAKYASFSDISYLFITQGGEFLLSDSDRIRIVLSNGTINTIAGGKYSNSGSGDGGLAINARLNNPSCIATNSNGEIFICESAYRIRKIFTNGTIITYLGNGNSGSVPDGTPISNAIIGSLFSIKFSSMGELYYSDSYGIHKVTLNSTITTISKEKGFISFNENENEIYILASEKYSIQKLSIIAPITNNTSNSSSMSSSSSVQRSVFLLMVIVAILGFVNY